METPILFYKKGTCSLGSMIAAEWAEIPYRLCRLDEDTIDSKEYLAINALGEVPALEIDSIYLTESIAILQHLGKKDLLKGLTFAQETLEFDKMNQVLSYLATDFKGSFKPLFSEGTSEADKKKIADTVIREQYHYVDQYLVQEGVIFGQKTIADAYLFGLVRWGNDLFDMEKEFPNIAAFQAEMNEDPGVKFALAMEEEKEATTSGKFEGNVELKSPESHLGEDFPGLQINRKNGKNEEMVAS